MLFLLAGIGRLVFPKYLLGEGDAHLALTVVFVVTNAQALIRFPDK